MNITLGQAINDARQRLMPVSQSASLDAQLLMAAVLNADRAHVIAHPERVLTTAQASAYAALVRRRADGEPVAYLLGYRAFYDRVFRVSPAVLVPRPETEHLVEAALATIAGRALTVVDVGTGSGAIAVTVKANAPQITMHATDISPDALAVAHANATEQGTDVIFHQGDLLAPLLAAGLRADLILANLPYIAAGELASLAVARHEPHLALDGGPDGLALFQRLFAQVPAATTPGATLLLEIGADQGESVPALARTQLPVREITVTQDYAGFDRLVQLTLGKA